jgi:PPIC-type PPIASE domain
VKRLLPIAVLGALALAVTGCQTATSAAVVNGVAIPQSELLSDLSAIAGSNAEQVSYASCLLELQSGSAVPTADGAGQGTVTQDLAKFQLENLIYEELVHQRLAMTGHGVTTADIDAATTDLVAQLSPGSSPCNYQGAQLVARVPHAFFHRQVVALAEQERLVSLLGHVDLGTDALQAYYQAHPEDFQLLCLSDIVVSSQAQAAQIRQQIASGATSFEAAAQNSLDQQTAGNGGQLGCVPMSQVKNQVVLQAIKGLAVGEVSQPVTQPDQSTGTGAVWILLKLDSNPVVPFLQSEQQIRQDLLSAHANPFDTAMNHFADVADVTVNPRYGSWNRLSGVEVPATPPARFVLDPIANLPVGNSAGTGTTGAAG